jgi:hypothetical protein
MLTDLLVSKENAEGRFLAEQFQDERNTPIYTFDAAFHEINLP